jgi:hypothetical protein
MVLVLELFKQGKEFVALFDHHDDLVVFVGEGKDSELSFCPGEVDQRTHLDSEEAREAKPKGRVAEIHRWQGLLQCGAVRAGNSPGVDIV